jgi:hypothetical protein
MATGDLVCWLNADDYFLPQAFRQVAEAFMKNQVAPFYFGDGVRVDKDKKVKGGFFPDGIVRFNQAALVLGLDYILRPSTFINRNILHLFSEEFCKQLRRLWEATGNLLQCWNARGDGFPNRDDA